MQLKVLLINDLDYWQEEISDALQKRDVRCDIANTLAEAKRKYQAENGDFDMIFMDGNVDDPDRTPSIDKTLVFVKWMLKKGYNGMLVANSTRYNAKLLEAGCKYFSHPTNTIDDLDDLLKEARKRRLKEMPLLARIREVVRV